MCSSDLSVAGSPRLAGPSSQASWLEAWNLPVSSLEFVKLEPGACQVAAWTLASSSLELQVRAWMLSTGGLGFAKFQAGTCQVGALGLSSGGLELVKFEPGSWQVEALNLTTLGCSWFVPPVSPARVALASSFGFRNHDPSFSPSQDANFVRHARRLDEAMSGQ